MCLIFDKLFQWLLYKRNDWRPNNQFDIDIIAIYKINSMSCILKSRNGHFCLSWGQRSSVINQKTFPDTVYKRQKHFHQSKIEFLYLVTHFTIFHPTDSLTASPSLKRWQTVTPWGVVCWNQMYAVDIFISVPFPTKVPCIMKDCRKSWLYEDFADFLKYIFFPIF